MWRGAVLKLRMCFSTEYPYSPPMCQFETQIKHPNVTEKGEIRSPLLEQWHPTVTIKSILDRIQSLLVEPCGDIKYIGNFSMYIKFLMNPSDYEAIVRGIAIQHTPMIAMIKWFATLFQYLALLQYSTLFFLITGYRTTKRNYDA